MYNLARSIWRVDKSASFPHSIEAFVLWDYDEKRRISETRSYAQKGGYTLPANLLDSNLLCYGNVWSLAHASALARGWSYFSREAPDLQRESGNSTIKLLDPTVRGMWPGESSPSSPAQKRIFPNLGPVPPPPPLSARTPQSGTASGSTLM